MKPLKPDSLRTQNHNGVAKTRDPPVSHPWSPPCGHLIPTPSPLPRGALAINQTNPQLSSLSLSLSRLAHEEISPPLSLPIPPPPWRAAVASSSRRSPRRSTRWPPSSATWPTSCARAIAAAADAGSSARRSPRGDVAGRGRRLGRRSRRRPRTWGGDTRPPLAPTRRSRSSSPTRAAATTWRRGRRRPGRRRRRTRR